MEIVRDMIDFVVHEKFIRIFYCVVVVLILLGIITRFYELSLMVFWMFVGHLVGIFILFYMLRRG